MNLPGLSIRRPTAVIMAILSLMLIGSISLSRLKLDLLPDLNMPTAVVTARYEGAGPKEIERLVTIPLEEVLAATTDLKSMETISASGYCLCILYFNDNTDMNFAALEIREKVDMAKAYLPEGVTDVMVMRIDPDSMQSAFEIGISSDMRLDELTRLVESQVAGRLERISGVAQAMVSGGLVQEIRIKLVRERLSMYGLDESFISSYIMTGNLNIPAGSIETAGMTINIRIAGEFGSVEEIRNLTIPTSAGSTVLLRDIADIGLVEAEKTSESYINGKPALSISIQKQSNANVVQVCREVKKELAQLEKLYPDIEFDIIYDSSKYIGMALDTVAESAVKGGILAAAILYLFLGNIRATLIIALSMPVSIIASFVLMYFSGISLNLISLAGFALGIGMLVDNSIVVLENIYRYRDEGKDLRTAAEYGTKEVMLSITASTFTTIIVFVPVIFVEGITGKVFREMGLIITYSLVASLIVAITFLPMMASKLMNPGKAGGAKKGLRIKLFDGWEKFYGKVCDKYRNFLEYSLKKSGLVIAAAAIIFALSLTVLPAIGFDYFPAMDEGIIRIEVTMPRGSALGSTREIAFEVQDRIKDIREIKGISMTIGNGDIIPDRYGAENAVINVDIGSMVGRKRTIKNIADDIRNRVSSIAGAKIKVIDDSRVMGFSIGSNKVDIRVTGEDDEILARVSDDLMEILSGIEGIRDLTGSHDQDIEEVSIVIDRNKALLYGLTPAQAGMAIQAGVDGIVSSRYKYRGSEINIVVSTADGNIESLQDILNISLQGRNGAIIPLSEIAEVRFEKAPSSIIRNDQKRAVVITADIEGRSIDRVTADIDRKISEYGLPAGVSYSYGGQQKDFIDSFDELYDALVLSVIIVYMLLAAQFESLIHPLTILLTLPLALTGALASLLVAGKLLSIPAFIGLIILVGIVVDNAIVLIDTVNRLREEGLSTEEALVRAGPLRLRPILMTTLTTILGMLPMALSRKEGSEIQAPLAVAVIGGLAVSMLITLIVIPSFYLTIENMLTKIRNKAKRKRPAHV